MTSKCAGRQKPDPWRAACWVVDCPADPARIRIATGIPAAWHGAAKVRPVVAESGQPDEALVPAVAIVATAGSATLS